MDKIILASGSPRRKAVLEQIKAEFTVMPSNIDEGDIYEQVSPYDTVKALSTRKATHVCSMVDLSEPVIIIAADTVVSAHGKILGKPEDEDSAYAMLKMLQGKAHSVYTGVTVIRKSDDELKLKNIVETTTVYMRKLTEQEILAYVETGEPFDKAGAYAVQGLGATLIEKIEGDYYNVVGLPIVKLCAALVEFGADLTQYWRK